MGESIGAHNGLVGLDHHAGEVGHQTRRLGDFFRAHTGQWSRTVSLSPEVGVVVTTSHMQCHHQLLKGGITGTFPDAVDRALKLSGTVLDGLKKIRDGQSQIVVAMHGNDGLLDVRDMVVDAIDQ